ncbi:MAG: hypothetical protein LBL35_03765 [Clostridiales bacterium]|jgi:hypothetical protein|nr:hypothetical protein [Clostridiales bacterium]
MRKTLVPALFVIFALSALTACRGGKSAPDNGDSASSKTPTASDNTSATKEKQPQSVEDNAKTSENEAQEFEASDQSKESLIQWMIDGSFSYDFVMTAEALGQKVESIGSMAANDGDALIITEVNAMGQRIKSKIIVKDDVTYIIDDANKLITKASNLSAEVANGMIADYSGLKLVNSGAGEIDGKTLPYEEYEMNGSTVKFYLENGQVYGMESEIAGHKTVTIITNPSNKVPDGAFDLPAGYKEM